jgi:hypothetical protein
MKLFMPEKKLFNVPNPSDVFTEVYPEYKLVIPAEEPVSRQLRLLRQQWEKQNESNPIFETIPAITIAHLAIGPEREPLLLKWLGKICASQTSFRVTLNNCSAIPPQTIYIRIQDATPFEALFTQLEEMHTFLKPTFDSHSQIFRKPFVKLGQMPQNATAKQWFFYTHQLFHASFMAKKLQLLHFENNNWKTIGLFDFKEPE